MTPPRIETPRGSVFVTPAGKAQLVWNTNFQPKWQGHYSVAQKFVDSEVLRNCEPFVPLKTGMLIKSGILGTIIGSGLVSWIAPYAKPQYYLRHRRPSQTGPLRGSFWFERAKAVYKHAWIAGARKLAGGGA
jgi:hypothetical protein